MFSDLLSSLRPLVSWLRKPPAYVWVILGVALALPVLFTFYTHMVWEDFLITYQFSDNLAHGRGLVYTPGERVHGFTSPLNTLLPALFAWVTGASDFQVPLWIFRWVSLALLAFGVVAATSVLAREYASSRAALIAALLFPIAATLEIKTTAFAMNGQEAGLVLGFLAPVLALVCLGWTPHWKLGGLLCAGLMYSRPDAFVYIGALAAASLAFPQDSRRSLLVAWLKSAAVCAALYLPWLLFVWSYYGSPIPHTVVAKAGIETYSTATFSLLAPFVGALRKAPDVLCWTLSPVYDWLDDIPGTWPGWMHDGVLVAVTLAIIYWALPTRNRVGRTASLAACVLFAYLLVENLIGQYCPWYFPPLAFLCLFVLISAIAHLIQSRPARLTGSVIGFVLLGMLGGLLSYEFFRSLKPLRFKQDVIEWNERRLIGLWLKDHVAPGETVYLEPLGYIGYFSQCHMLDWPGLVSPRIVDIRRQIPTKHGYTMVEVAQTLKPDWIVARSQEITAMKEREFFVRNYTIEKVYNLRDEILAAGPAPGMRMVYAESVFAIMRLKKQ